MTARSSLARMQQAIVFALVALVCAWAFWQWDRSHIAAAAGAFLIAFGYSVVLAIEFVLLKSAGLDADTPAPTWTEAARAWWGETCVAAQVFYWRQPFRWRKEADLLEGAAGKPGVLLVHGFVCNRGFWNPWMQKLRRAGHPFIAVNLEPVFGAIPGYAPLIDAAVQRLAAATGQPPLIVCHSMGGLAVRAWLKTSPRPVHHVVTIGSPHRGTWLGRFSHTPNGRQMRLEGEWVRDLARHQHGVPFTCWYSNCDNIVFPASTATLPGADNRFVRGVAHVELAFIPEVFTHALGLLARS